MISKTIRLSDSITKVAKFLAKKEGIDESTLLRKLIRKGGEKYLCELFGSGGISLREIAGILDISLYDALELTLSEGVKGNVTAEQVYSSLEAIKSHKRPKAK